MTPPHHSLRIALLDSSLGDSPQRAGEEAVVHALSAALREAGHRPAVLHSASMTPATGWLETALRLRGFTTGLVPLPAQLGRLVAGGFDIAHAFTVSDALVAAAWGRWTGRPSLFTWTEAVSRERLADRRLRLRSVRIATEQVDALISPDDAVREGLRRWLAVEAAVAAPSDVVAHERIYREASDRKGPRG